MNQNESVLFRENIVTQLNYDIFAISESHLRPNESIKLKATLGMDIIGRS